MNELAELCGGDVASFDLDALRDSCRSFGAALGLPVLEIVMMALFGLFGFVGVSSMRRGESAPTIVGNGFEAALYGALGFFAGSAFGLFAAEVVPPLWFAAIVLGHCIVAFVWVMLGVLGEDADGDAGSKATAVVLGAVLVALGGVVLALAIAVPRSGPAGDQYGTYLNVVAIVLGFLGAVDGIVVAGTRGVHWAVGWLLVPVNASWGFLGNILGLGNHLASYFCFGQAGSGRGGGLETARRKVHQPYTLYKRGLTLKRTYVGDGAGGVAKDPVTGKRRISQRFAFTQGWVVSCEHGGDVERHELIHVAQHLVLGPIYFLSHAVWDVIGFLVGWVASWGKLTFDTAVTNMAYYNNPYEIMAYASHNGARDTATSLVFRKPWAGIFATLWIVGAIVAFFVLVLVVWS